MDIFNDHSDPESQPTQLLKHALTKQNSIAEHSDEWGLNHGCDQEGDDRNLSANFSTDSMMVPPARGSTSRYQFNWVATPTQPQVLHREEEIVEEGSQKENAPASNENKRENVVRTRSSSPQASLAKPVNVKGSHADTLSHPDSRTASGIGKANVPKSVSFQSPRSARLVQPLLQPTKSLPVAPSRHRRSPSLSSQDSFGGAVSQDPAANYIAQATQVFDVPLSDLGHTTATDLAMDDPMDYSSRSQEEEEDSWMDKMRRAYEQTKASGSILVAGTPSHSGGSEGSSQNASFPHPDASQLLNDEDSLESLEAQRNRYGQANASQSSLIVAEDEFSEEKIPPTIPEPFAPTQLSTPLDNTATSAITEDLYARTLRSRSARATFGTTFTPGPRGLLSLIRPEQRERRLRIYGSGAGATPPPVRDSAAMQPLESAQTPNEYVETQLSNFVATHPPDLHSGDNDMPPPVRQPPSSHYPRLLQPQDNNLDIVPDSEPPVPSAATPTRNFRLNESPTKRPFCPLSPMSELSSGEIVADSVVMPESSQDPEGDVPLAALLQVKSATKKSAAAPASGKTCSSIPPPPVLVKKSVKPQVNPSTTKPKSSTRGKKAKQESGEIPTSAPEQDLRDLMATPTVVPPSVKNGKGKGKAPPVPSTRKSTRTRAALSAKKRKPSSDTEAYDDNQDETHPTAKAEKQEEEETELADDEDYMDVGPAPAEIKAPSSRKRRRVEDVKPARAPSKASTRSKTSETPVPATRAAKRFRHTVSTGRALAAQPATRVFALWRQDGHYYAGTVHSLEAGTKYEIKFDDDTKDFVDVAMLRQCKLRVGDAVIICHDNVRGTVVDISQIESGTVGIEVDDGSDSVSSDYGIADIRIASRAIQSHWKDRTLTADSIIPVIRPKPLRATSSPSGMSLMSATSVKKPFAKTGFVVTRSVQNEHPVQMKDNVMLAVKHNGGTVIDDWSSIFPIDGVHSQSSKRWVASQENFKFKPKPEFEGLERVFLLADDYNQKPKFLVALALGIPCLSHEWIRDDYRNTQILPDWQSVLLPAGFSETLSARVSQLVDLDWGNCKEHLSDIMSNTVASKLFSGKTVLCLGPDLVPLRGANKASSDNGKAASQIVPWIMICMGAARVEAVTEVKFASKDLPAYDYVIVKEATDFPKNIQDDVTLVHVPWVKDCLISGRLLSLPSR